MFISSEVEGVIKLAANVYSVLHARFIAKNFACITLRDRCFYYPHFVGKETEAQKLNNMPKIM